MSLKAFHIIFIIASTILTTAFGIWALRQFSSDEGSATDLALGVISLVLTAALVCYGRYFLRKLKHISYL